MTSIERSRISPLKLSRDDVHVWRVSLSEVRPPALRPALQRGQSTNQQLPPGVQQLSQTLSEEERIRAARFHFERDRRRFVVGRGALKTILGLYLNVEPGQLQIHYGPYGKPYLRNETRDPVREGEPPVRPGATSQISLKDRLEFNLSHSHELAIYAFTLGRKVGIDLEYIRQIPDAEQIAARFFSKRENAVLNALPASQRQEAFFNCWTRKEAYIKAVGDGLAQPLDKFDVSLTPGEPARLLNVEGNPGEASRWSLAALSPAPGYAAALAVEGHGWRLQWKQ